MKHAITALRNFIDGVWGVDTSSWGDVGLYEALNDIAKEYHALIDENRELRKSKGRRERDRYGR